MFNTLVRRIVVLSCAALLVPAAAAPALAQFVRYDRMLAFDKDVCRVWAGSGYHRVVVEGEGDTDLDCFGYDRAGNLLGSDTDETDYCIVPIYQRAAGNLRTRFATSEVPTTPIGSPSNNAVDPGGRQAAAVHAPHTHALHLECEPGRLACSANIARTSRLKYRNHQ